MPGSASCSSALCLFHFFFKLYFLKYVDIYLTGILKLYAGVLEKMDFIHMAQFLTKLPEDICGDKLFKEVDSVRMSIDKRGFLAAHAFFKDLAENTSLS